MRKLGSSRWLLYSLLLHLAVVGGLLYLSREAVKEALVWMADSQQESQEEEAMASGPMAEIEVVPFGGISYSQYVARKEKQAAEQREDKASSLLSRLRGTRLSGAGAGSGGTPSLGSALKAVSGQAASTGGRPSGDISRAVRGQAFSFKTAPVTQGGARKMTDAEKAALKAKFRSLEAKFRKVYAQALNKEPQLQVTIAFEAKVSPTGFLSVSNFKASGNYRPESLEALKGEMASLIAQVYVAKDLQGTIIRGESVFIR